MTESRVSCALCGRTFTPDTNHAVVDVETVRIDDHNDELAYYLHQRCSVAVFSGWQHP